MRKYPVGMVLGGYYYWGDGSPGYQGTNGFYWSSSAHTSATYAYGLGLYNNISAVGPANSSYKRNGFSLRCLGNTTGEFQSLYNQYPTYDQMRKYPVGMVLGGRYYWSDGAIDLQGTRGYYWSSSAYTSATHAYNLRLVDTNSTVAPADSSNKRNGFTLRCLAKKENNNFEIPHASQPVALLENTKLFTITIIAMML